MNSENHLVLPESDWQVHGSTNENEKNVILLSDSDISDLTEDISRSDISRSGRKKKKSEKKVKESKEKSTRSSSSKKTSTRSSSKKGSSTDRAIDESKEAKERSGRSSKSSSRKSSSKKTRSTARITGEDAIKTSQEDENKTSQEDENKTNQEDENETNQEDENKTNQEDENKTSQEEENEIIQEDENETSREHENETSREHENETSREHEKETSREHEKETSREHEAVEEKILTQSGIKSSKTKETTDKFSGFEKPSLLRRERSLTPALSDMASTLKKVQAGELITSGEALLLTIYKLKIRTEKVQEDQDQLIYRVEQLESLLDIKEAKINDFCIQKVSDGNVKDLNLLLENLSIKRDFHKRYLSYRSSVERFVDAIHSQHVAPWLSDSKAHSISAERLKAGEVIGNEEALLLTLQKLRDQTEKMEEVRHQLVEKIEEMEDLLEDKEAKIKALELHFQKMGQPQEEKEDNTRSELNVDNGSDRDHGMAELDSAELDAILENLDIDGDSDLFSSPRDETLEKEKWRERMGREEVYSRRYRPSTGEQQELDELERELQLKPSKANAITSFLETAMDPNKSVWKLLAHPDRRDPCSIILKRGHVLYETSAENEKDAELIFLTHGFVVATTTMDKREAGRVIYKFERAIEWTSLLSAGQVQIKECAWEMLVQPSRGPARLVFVAPDPIHYAAWLEALELIVVNCHMHDNNSPKDPGWQHKIISKPAFTMAVLGVEDGLPVRKNTLDELDSYNGYAPLHYAVRLRHERIVQLLLQEGADPNLEDGDGLTPVYHAVHEEAPDSMIALLERFGAKDIDRIKRENEDLHERVISTKNERELQAQATMSENMRLLQERQEKIDESGDRARQMNENAAEYVDLARQLKQKTQEQAGMYWNPLSRQNQK